MWYKELGHFFIKCAVENQLTVVNEKYGISEGNYEFGISEGNYEFGISEGNYKFGFRLYADVLLSFFPF